MYLPRKTALIKLFRGAWRSPLAFSYATAYTESSTWAVRARAEWASGIPSNPRCIPQPCFPQSQGKGAISLPKLGHSTREGKFPQRKLSKCTGNRENLTHDFSGYHALKSDSKSKNILLPVCTEIFILLMVNFIFKTLFKKRGGCILLV